MPDSNNNTLCFEQSLQNLEMIVTKLETGDLSLEESLAYFEQGIKLTAQCQQALTQAEQKISMLTANSDLIPYEDSDVKNQ